MKNKFLLIFLFTALILSFSIVSASWFDKITGRATSDLRCFDSDNGINYLEKGSIKLTNEYSSGEEFDKCTGIGEGISELICGYDGCGYAIVYPTNERKNTRYMLVYDNGNCNQATATGGFTYDCSVEGKICSEGKCVENSTQKCIPNWECGNWSHCQKFRTSSMNFILQQTRNCEDENNCATLGSKPAVVQSCSNPCIENWLCSQWSNCTDEKQTRICNELNYCSTQWDKPIEFKDCQENLLSYFLKNEEIAMQILNKTIVNYSIREAEHKELGMNYLNTSTFAFRFIMGLKQLGYTFVQDSSNNSQPLYLNTYYKFLSDNGFEKTEGITKEILMELDSKLLLQEQIDKENYDNLTKILDLQEINPIFPNYPPKEHFYSVVFNFLINLPEPIRNYENRILGGQGFDYFISISPNMFFPPSESTFEYLILKSDCDTLSIIAHEWAHNVDFELILPENQSEIDTRFSFFGSPLYKTDKSLDYYSISWTDNIHMINTGFVSSYGMYHEGDNLEYPHPAEDFAEHFSMYVTQGRIFRYLTSKNEILNNKYNWLRDNVFFGVEYDTGNPNFLNYAPDDTNWTNHPYDFFNDVIDYSENDFNYRCSPINIIKSALNLNKTQENTLLTKQNLLQCENGCIIEDKCLPISIRSGDYYCNLDKKIEEQKSFDEQCENNFECSSNICIDNNCVDSNIWNKFISWFRNIFS